MDNGDSFGDAVHSAYVVMFYIMLAVIVLTPIFTGCSLLFGD